MKVIKKITKHGHDREAAELDATTEVEREAQLILSKMVTFIKAAAVAAQVAQERGVTLYEAIRQVAEVCTEAPAKGATAEMKHQS